MASSNPSSEGRLGRLFHGVPAALVVLAFAIAVMVFSGLVERAGGVAVTMELVFLVAAVAGAVHHAEKIAEALGEPYGTLVLTLAVTIIECSLIVAIMSSGGTHGTLARDTVFSVIMLVMNGLVGLCFLIGGLRFGEQTFRAASARSYLMVLIPFGTLTMVLPAFTVSVAGPFYSTAQVVFVSVVTIALYGIFLYVQTVRHRGFFGVDGEEEGDGRATKAGWTTYFALFVLLTAIVLLAKSFAGTIEQVVTAIGAPKAVVGVLVALLVLLPEGIAAVQAARADQLQRSINLALGSTLATIGLTFPAVGFLTLHLGKPLVLGLEPTSMVLLVLTMAVGMVTLSGGRTNILSGAVHLVLLATFAFLLFVP